MRVLLSQHTALIVLQLNLWWSGQEQSGCLCPLSQHRPSNRYLLQMSLIPTPRCKIELYQLTVLSAGGTEALNISSSSNYNSDPATTHHACNSNSPDPAQLHQPPTRHCPGISSRRRECGLRSCASTVRYTGSWCFCCFLSLCQTLIFIQFIIFFGVFCL